MKTAPAPPQCATNILFIISSAPTPASKKITVFTGSGFKRNSLTQNQVLQLKGPTRSSIDRVLLTIPLPIILYVMHIELVYLIHFIGFTCVHMLSCTVVPTTKRALNAGT